ncbi:MAG: DUF2062 domain-containing protein [Desulfatibacillaceae bacterium]
MFAILKNAYYRFVKIRGNPVEIALGLALGVFVGFSPTLGAQMIIVVFLAALLKWNKISAALGVWISNPLTAPFLYSLTYRVGSRVYGLGNNYPLEQEAGGLVVVDLLQRAPEVFLVLFIGGVVVGLPAAVLAYILAHNAIVRYRETLKQRLDQQKQMIARGRERILRKKHLRKKPRKTHRQRPN